jgi:hypothetical protein
MSACSWRRQQALGKADAESWRRSYDLGLHVGPIPPKVHQIVAVLVQKAFQIVHRHRSMIDKVLFIQ